MIEKSPFSNLDHIGVIVRDTDMAVDYYQSLGIGPFELMNISAKDRKLRGKPIGLDSFKLKEKWGKMGSIGLQVIQPIEGEFIWKEFLETKGEGVHHLAFSVNDIEKEEAKMLEKGVEAVYSARFQGGGGAAYFDTAKVGGVLIELVQWSPE